MENIKFDMIYIIWILVGIIYLLGATFFWLLTGLDISKVGDLLTVLFYPITMWFLK